MGTPPLVGTPASRRSKNRAIVIVVVVVLVIAGGIGAYLYYVQTQNVDVNAFLSYSPNNVCGLAANPVSWTPGFNDTPGAVDEFEIPVPNFNFTSCTVHGLTTNSSGFSISGQDVPLAIPAATISGGPGSGNLFFNLTLPGSSWSGNVNLIFT
jgi:hypothetical protein